MLISGFLQTAVDYYDNINHVPTPINKRTIRQDILSTSSMIYENISPHDGIHIFDPLRADGEIERVGTWYVNVIHSSFVG
jgi:hypothetical protein